MCLGSGTNLRLNSADPMCPNCKGSGACPACGGSGSVARADFEGGFSGARNGRLRLALVSAAAFFLVLGYCGLAQRRYVPLATDAAEVFHKRFAAGQDDIIYAQSDRAWSQVIDAQTERKFFSRIRRKMGACSYTGPLRWIANSNAGSGSTFVTLTFDASCEKGRMRERFTWRVVKGRALLAGYEASSNVLLTD